MKLVKAILITLFCSSVFTLLAQEQLGLRIETYSGINSVTINPANNLTSSFKWDVNLAAVGIFGENNYGYIRNTNLIHAAQNAEDIQSAPDLPEGYQITDEDLIADYYDNNKKKYFSFLTNVMGPSFMVNLESGHSFGLFTRMRTAGSIRNIPAHLGYYQLEQVAYDEPFEIPEAKGSGMLWSEIGVNYAISMPTSEGSLGFGINLKYLQGYEAFYVVNNASTTIANSRGDTISSPAANFEFAFTDSNADGEDPSLTKNGSGIGVDLGAFMTIGGDGPDYIWKLGASIIDIGRIKFNDNAQRHRFTSSSPFQIAGQDYESIDNVDDGIQALSFDIMGDSTASRVSNEFGVWLPAALSLQADYNLMPNVFVNATLVQRIPMGKGALQRDNLLAIAPRFERRWFGASLPLVLYNYTKVRIGTALRLGFLTIGSDHIGSIFNRSDFSGSDFYLALKVNPFNLDFGGRNGGKSVKCYDF